MIRKFKYFLTFILLWLWVNIWFAQYTLPIWQNVESYYDESINLSVLPKWSFISSRFWLWKAVFSPVSIIEESNYDERARIMYLFWNDSKPYLYTYLKMPSRLNFSQWYITAYQICDQLIWDETSKPWNCNSYSLTTAWNVETVKNFLSSVWLNDYYFYYYSNPNVTYADNYMQLCISSSEFHKSICFQGGCNWSSSVCTPLTWSLWLMPKLSFEDLSDYLLNSSPAVWNSSNVSSWNTINWDTIWLVENLNGDVIYWNCTNWKLLNYFRNAYWMNDVMCYGWLSSLDYNLTWYTVTPWQWVTVFRMYEDAIYWNDHPMSFVEWFDTISYNYSADKYWNNWLWVQYPTVYYTYFDILYNNWLLFGWKDIYNYCYALLESDLEWSLNPEYILPDSEREKICKRIADNDTSTNYNVQSWSAVWNDLNGVWSIWMSDLSWSNFSWTRIVDWTNFINNYVNILKQNFQIDKNNNVWWIVPVYIIAFLFFIMLFKFLRN